MEEHPRPDFAYALRFARAARGLSQESFEVPNEQVYTSRVYISALERGVKQPTLGKVDVLAEVLGVHPLTLLALTYLDDVEPQTIRELWKRVSAELRTLARAQS